MLVIDKISAKETLQVRQKVLWPLKPLTYVMLANDEEGMHYGLFLEGELITVLSVFINDGAAQFRKFATLEKFQGKGYGSKVFEFMLKDLKSYDVHKIWCNARLEANRFYQNYGFVIAKDKAFVKEGVAYTIMEKQL